MRAVWAFLSKPFKKDKSHVETSLIEQYLYPKKGPGQLWETLASRVEEMGGEIIRSCRVEAIETDGRHISGIIVDRGGVRERMTADVYFPRCR